MELKENWSDTKIKLQCKYSQLKDMDTEFSEDKQESMLSEIQLKFGITREELLNIINAA